MPDDDDWISKADIAKIRIRLRFALSGVTGDITVLRSIFRIDRDPNE